MEKFLLVAFGSAIGGALRYWMSGAIYKFLPATLPYGTLAVNVIGSFVLGFIVFYLDARELISTNFRIMLTVGFCGGFTTFSTFSLETINLIKDSEYLFALLNIFLNVFLTLAALALAYYLSKTLN